MAPKTKTDSPLDGPSPNSTPPVISGRREFPMTDLVLLLDGFSGQPDSNGRVLFFVRLVQSMRSGSQSTYRSLHRLEQLLSLLESDALQRASFQKAFHAMLAGTQSINLFAESGLHPRESLWSEVLRRLVERVLPSAREEDDLSKLVYRMYPDQRYIQSFLQMPDELFRRVILVLTPEDNPAVWNLQKEFLGQALCLLGSHVAGVSLSQEFRERCHSFPVEQSPFYRLQRITGDLASEIDPAAASAAVSALQTEMVRCRVELEYMHERMEFLGVSTALEFNISTVERAIRRIERIVAVLFQPSAESFNNVKKLLDDVMSARLEDLSLSALVRENTSLLARKIVERTGRTGEHYIANNRSEYRKMWKAALGGGLLVVATAAIKMKVTTAQLPPFIEGFLVGTNYAITFLTLQALGLALATKQPSMTAATYAKIVRETEGTERLEKLTEFISRITRTQLAAAVGNLLTVTLGAILFAAAWSRLYSEPYLPPTSSRYVYETLNPLASGTAVYAALTGFVLWISALAGGWVENFAAYNRVSEAIADHPLGLRFGFDRMRRYADLFERNISGWSTSIVLGYLLGFIPVAGHMFGVPLDVRHVTLSTGTLALAAASLGRDWLYRGWFLHTVFGIAIIFVLNLGVSFGIASWVALRAYGVPRADQMQLLRYVVKSFCKSPRRFLYPRANG
jgi:site-specific recombinase